MSEGLTEAVQLEGQEDAWGLPRLGRNLCCVWRFDSDILGRTLRGHPACCRRMDGSEGQSTSRSKCLWTRLGAERELAWARRARLWGVSEGRAGGTC